MKLCTFNSSLHVVCARVAILLNFIDCRLQGFGLNGTELKMNLSSEMKFL